MFIDQHSRFILKFISIIFVLYPIINPLFFYIMKLHKDFDVLIDRSIESIRLSFKLKRERKGKIEWEKEVIMTLREFEQFFRMFRKFQNSFFYLFEIYIKNLQNSYEFQFFPL